MTEPFQIVGILVEVLRFFFGSPTFSKVPLRGWSLSRNEAQETNFHIFVGISVNENIETYKYFSTRLILIREVVVRKALFDGFKNILYKIS